jgi:chromosome segregation ATPase
MSDPRLKKGLFGYTEDSVRVLLEDRERMFQQASEEARAAEARADQLRSAVEVSERELNDGVEELRMALEETTSLRSELETIRGELEAAKASSREDASAAVDLVEARAQVARLTERADSAESRAARLQGELEQQRDASAGSPAPELEAELSSLRENLESLRGEREAALSRNLAAEARVRDLEADLGSARGDLEEARRDAASVRTRLEQGQIPSSTQAGSPTAKDVSILLQSTEETMARIIQEAKIRTDAELAEAERAWGRVQEDTRRLRAWRERVAPLVGEFRDSVEDARQRAAEIPAQVLEALSPMTEVIEALGRRLEEMAQVAKPTPAAGQPVAVEAEGPRVIELREPEGAAEAPGRGTSSGSEGP